MIKLDLYNKVANYSYFYKIDFLGFSVIIIWLIVAKDKEKNEEIKL